MAFAFASETAEHATYDAIHFHGGYGFMLEHDVQLHYRRARGWARVWGDAEAGYRRAAAARYGPRRRRRRTARSGAGGVLMDFAWDPEVEALRAEVRDFLAEHLTPELEERLYRSGVSHDDDFARALGERAIGSLPSGRVRASTPSTSLGARRPGRADQGRRAHVRRGHVADGGPGDRRRRLHRAARGRRAQGGRRRGHHRPRA